MKVLNKEVLGKNTIGLEVGLVTVDVPYHGVVTTEYYAFDEDCICIMGFVGQYRTGQKLWYARIIYNEKTCTYRFSFGRDNNNEQQRNNISFNHEACVKDAKKVYQQKYKVAN